MEVETLLCTETYQFSIAKVVDITLGDPGQDYEAPGQDSGDAFSSVCSCVVFVYQNTVCQYSC